MHASISVPSVIYDFGANNGDDIPYYLQKADKVVAVEANPALAGLIAARFASEISEKRLVLENVAVTAESSASKVTFYLHRDNHLFSTLVKPSTTEAYRYDKFDVSAVPASQLVQKHGAPLYIKIDLEGFDVSVLRDLFNNHISPLFISAEGHDPAVLGILNGMGGFTRFKIVRGEEVGGSISSLPIKNLEGSLVQHIFPPHSAGPFGDDIPGQWLNARDLFSLLRAEGTGWYDIHAQLGAEPQDSLKPAAVARALLKSSIAMSFPNTAELFRKGRAVARRNLGRPK